MADGIVLIHGFPLDSSMWAPQAPALARETTLVTPNLPGFGGAAHAGKIMEMSEAADAVAKAMRQAGVTRGLVCGLSMGGYVAFALWRQHPDLVAGFVFANTKASADDEAAQERRRQLAARIHSEGSEFLIKAPGPLLTESAHAALWGFARNIIAAQPAESIAAASRGMAERPDSTPDLATITVPTLVITGSKDTLIPPEATKPIADGISGARYEVIEGAGHLSNLEGPERFNALMLEQWGRVK